MTVFKKIILVLLVVLIIMQFFHAEKNTSAAVPTNGIAAVYGVPADVAAVLSKACNDCHSNNTKYPWYNNIQPVAWWLNDHVRDGKRSLNFDEFGSYRIAKQYHRMQDVIDEVKHGEMPLSSYTLIHTDARLTDQEKAVLLHWASNIRDTMKARYSGRQPRKKKAALTTAPLFYANTVICQPTTVNSFTTGNAALKLLR